MIAPDIPENEASRLLALRSLLLLDTAPEERFDRVTRMAKKLFGVSIALVSLIDENRQWFKSCIGFNVSETERRVSFCGHAILQQGTFIINDALTDERFSDNPLVTGEPYIRFYAGQPLRTLSGLALGTLCLLDTNPREFDGEDIKTLEDLAGMVERELIAIQLSLSDELTNISNRRGFQVLARYSLDVCKRQLFPASLVYFDLDKFKHINDTFGHLEGDKALKLFVEQMRASLSSSDVFARLGGDEFVALLTNISPEAVLVIIKNFEKALIARCASMLLPYAVQFSYGIVAYEPLKHRDIDDLLHESDELMYAQKSSKKSV